MSNFPDPDRSSGCGPVNSRVAHRRHRNPIFRRKTFKSEAPASILTSALRIASIRRLQSLLPHQTAAFETSTMATVAKEPAAADKKQRPNALRSIIAGSTAGAIEIGMSFVARASASRFFRYANFEILRSHYLSRRMCVCAAAVLNETGENPRTSNHQKTDQIYVQSQRQGRSSTDG